MRGKMWKKLLKLHIKNTDLDEGLGENRVSASNLNEESSV